MGIAPGSHRAGMIGMVSQRQSRDVGRAGPAPPSQEKGSSPTADELPRDRGAADRLVPDDGKAASMVRCSEDASFSLHDLPQTPPAMGFGQVTGIGEEGQGEVATGYSTDKMNG